jgi:hypothetical protein
LPRTGCASAPGLGLAHRAPEVVGEVDHELAAVVERHAQRVIGERLDSDQLERVDRDFGEVVAALGGAGAPVTNFALQRAADRSRFEEMLAVGNEGDCDDG